MEIVPVGPSAQPFTLTYATDLVLPSSVDPDGQIATFGRAWLTGYSSEHTRRAYRKDLETWMAWCEQRDLDPWAVRRANVDAYARDMEASGLSDTTQARRLASLAKFYRYLIVEGPLESSPVADVERPKVDRDHSTTIGIDREEARALISVAEAHSPRSNALIRLLVGNGLRVGEALHSEISDMTTQRGHRVLTVKGKGKHTDDVVLAPSTAAAIDAYMEGEGREKGLIFLTGTGKRLNQSDAFRMLRRLARKAGIQSAEKLSPHGLRHTAITQFLDAGGSLRDAQDFARHADPRTTRRYDRARNNLDRHGAYKLAAWLADEGDDDDDRS